MKASSALKKQFMKEIVGGRAGREQFGQESGIPLEDLVRSEMNPAISYVGQSGQVSTDEPTIMPIGSSQGDLNLVRQPMYDALIDEIRRKKLMEGLK